MDQKLLQALNNISDAMDLLAEAIKSKKEAKSSTAKALNGGNFGKQIQTISAEVKSIKSDTSKILKNQETLISLSKEKESKKTETIKDAGTKDQKEAIKKGAGTILLIAGAVLAIGTAFNIVGKVDYLSVISLSLAISVMSLAFEKVGQIENLNIAKAGMIAGTLILISTAITASSYILSLLNPVSFLQLGTAIMISGMFAVIGYSMGKFISSFDKLKTKDIVKASIMLPIILPAIALGIAASSYALSLVQPIGIMQFFSAVMIGATFTVLSFGMKKILESFKDVSPKKAMVASFVMPILFTAMSFAIYKSSEFLANVTPISLMSFITTVGIALTFGIIGIALRPIINKFGKMNEKNALNASYLMPLLFTAMSLSILLSSIPLSNVTPITSNQFFTSVGIALTFGVIGIALGPVIDRFGEMNKKKALSSAFLMPILFTAISLSILASSFILGQMKSMSLEQMKQAAILGGTLSIISLIMYPTFKLMKKLSPTSLIKGGLAIIGIATVISLSSHILSMGDYGDYPNVDWSTGVSISLIAFGLGAVGLGLFVSGPQALVFLAGLGAILGVAGTIVTTSHILKNGDYSSKGMLDWAKSTALLYATFAPIMVVLGGVALASSITSVFGVDPWKKAQTAMVDVAKTIVSVSYELKKGTYNGGPTKEWAKGIALTLGAFSPVYGMLMANSIFSIFGGVGPDDFKNAIKVISSGIVDSAEMFKGTSGFTDGPSEEWAKGVGLSIGAFAPVYEVLAKNSGWFKSGVSIEDFKKSIKTISYGIIESADIFASSKNYFSEGNYPSEKWAKGVGLSIGAFAPVYEVLSKKFKSGVSIEDFKKSIKTISYGIIESAEIFTSSNNYFSEGNYPSKKWSEGIKSSLSSFMPIFDMINDKSWLESKSHALNRIKHTIKSITNTMVDVAKSFFENKKFFGVTIDKNYVSSIKNAIIDFNGLLKEISKSESGWDKISNVANSLVGTDPITQIARRLTTLSKGYDNLASSLNRLGLAMKTLNIVNVKELGNLTRELTLPGEISLKRGDSPIDESVDNIVNNKGLSSINQKSFIERNISNNKDFSEKLDKVIELLSNIDKQTYSIDNIANDVLIDEDPKKPE